MGGGKSRAICEEAFDLALEHPGLPVLICRLRHTSIIETTKRTMLEEVIPHPDMITKKKESGGEDYIRLYNGSVIHFIGLEDPVRWFSSNLGALAFDEAHEISEDAVLKLITRLRHKSSPKGVLPDGREYAGKVLISFNPENPGHWLHQWFVIGASPTNFGYYKRELWVTGAQKPIGDAEFIFAKATDNPYLPPSYVEDTLAALPEVLRRRYLEGEWVFLSGSCFFDSEALEHYQKTCARPRYIGSTVGDPSGKDPKDKVRIRPGKEGPWLVWEPPVRARYDERTDRMLPAHRYIAAVDTSSGGSIDYSAIQVIDVDEFAQVAEYQCKLDPDLLALEAFRIGRIYNNALIAPEITGGWGASVVRELERLRYPRIYTRRIEDRLRKTWTDKLGWDTTSRSRFIMLDTLERVLREREFCLRGERTLSELQTFVRQDDPAQPRYGHPQAQSGCNDDLVIALAIAVTLASSMPREIRRIAKATHSPQFSVTGY